MYGQKVNKYSKYKMIEYKEIEDNSIILIGYWKCKIYNWYTSRNRTKI